MDAGSGPGRFSIAAADLGAKVTVLDLSSSQLKIAKEKIGQAGLLENVEDFVQGDITDLSAFPDGHFDTVICYGGALSYVCERRHEAASELVRIVRPGGAILVSVMSRYGASLNLVRRPTMPLLQEPEGWSWNVWDIIEDGDLSGFPSVTDQYAAPANASIHERGTARSSASLRRPGTRGQQRDGFRGLDSPRGSGGRQSGVGDCHQTRTRVEQPTGTRGHRKPHNHGRAQNRLVDQELSMRGIQIPTYPLSLRERARERVDNPSFQRC